MEDDFSKIKKSGETPENLFYCWPGGAPPAHGPAACADIPGERHAMQALPVLCAAGPPHNSIYMVSAQKMRYKRYICRMCVYCRRQEKPLKTQIQAADGMGRKKPLTGRA